MSCFATWLCLAALLPLPSDLPTAPTAVVPVRQAESAVSEPLVTDRPDATESAETVAAGRVQMETGYTFSRIERTDGHSLGEVLVRIGVADDFELRAGINSHEWARGPGHHTSGFADTSVGLKWRIAEAGAPGTGRPGLALLASTSLPTGGDGFSDGAAQPELILAGALDLSDRVGVGANFGWSYRNDPDLDRRFSELVASVAVGLGLSDRWGAYAEYFGAYGLDGREDESFLNGGLTYLISSDLQLDGRIGHGLNGRTDDLFAGIGAAVRW